MSSKKSDGDRLLEYEPVAAVARMLSERGGELPAHWELTLRQMMVTLGQVVTDQDDALKVAQVELAPLAAMREQLCELRDGFLAPLLHQCEGDQVAHRVSVEDLRAQIAQIDEVVG